MSISVEVSLLSGKTATVEAGQDETVETLTQRAQIALGVGRGRLLDSSGVILDNWAETTSSRDSERGLADVACKQSSTSVQRFCFCCHSWRWIRRDLGCC